MSRRGPSPAPRAAASPSGDAIVYEVAAAVLSEVRKVKSTSKRSLATPVVRAVVSDTEERLRALEAARADVCEAGKIRELVTEVRARRRLDGRGRAGPRPSRPA